MNEYEQRLADVRAIYPNRALADVGMLLAGTHPFAIDYLRQAPVLALAASYGGVPHRRGERARVAQWFGSAINRRPRLRALMAHYKLPLPLRAIKGSVLAMRHYHALSLLGEMKPSTLAQIIPQSGQMTWLRALSDWQLYVSKRNRARSFLFQWAAVAFSGVKECELPTVGDLLDFATESGETFNTKWTRAQALKASERWHLRLAKQNGEKQFYEAFGISFDAPIDYAPFPPAASCAGFDILALDSGEKIFAEGIAMHHCVSTYSKQVLYGQSRIFSMQKQGARVATVEYALQGRRYKVVQCKGPCNAAVAKPVWKAAEQFIAADWARAA